MGKKKDSKKQDPDFDFEDAETLVRDEEAHQVDDATIELIGGKPGNSSPPALPFMLQRGQDPQAWLDALPEASRAVLESARQPARSWPDGPRMPGAVAKPLAPPPKNAPKKK